MRIERPSCTEPLAARVPLRVEGYIVFWLAFVCCTVSTFFIDSGGNS